MHYDVKSVLDSQKFACYSADSKIFLELLQEMKDTTSQTGINRRSFLQSSAAVGASLAFSPYIYTQAASGASSGDDFAVQRHFFTGFDFSR